MREVRAPEDDSELLALCRSDPVRRESAFEKLLERHKSMVYTLCFRMTGNAADGEDLMQEVFTKAYLSLDAFEQRSAFSTWLYRIAYNRCLNFLEKRRTAELVEANYLQTRGPAPDAGAAGDIQQVLQQLPDEYRSVLVLKYIVGLEIADIAATTSSSVGAVKMRLMRARESFRNHYAARETPLDTAKGGQDLATE